MIIFSAINAFKGKQLEMYLLNACLKSVIPIIQSSSYSEIAPDYNRFTSWLLENSQAGIVENIVKKLLKPSFKMKSCLEPVDDVQRTLFLLNLWQERLIPLQFHSLLFKDLMHYIRGAECGFEAKSSILKYFCQASFVNSFDIELLPIFRLFFQEICDWFLEESLQSKIMKCLTKTVMIWCVHPLVMSMQKVNTDVQELVWRVMEKIQQQSWEMAKIQESKRIQREIQERERIKRQSWRRKRIQIQNQEREQARLRSIESSEITNGVQNLSISSDTGTCVKITEIVSEYPKLPE
jgi:hypothetical protein